MQVEDGRGSRILLCWIKTGRSECRRLPEFSSTSTTPNAFKRCRQGPNGENHCGIMTLNSLNQNKESHDAFCRLYKLHWVSEQFCEKREKNGDKISGRGSAGAGGQGVAGAVYKFRPAKITFHCEKSAAVFDGERSRKPARLLMILEPNIFHRSTFFTVLLAHTRSFKLHLDLSRHNLFTISWYTPKGLFLQNTQIPTCAYLRMLCRVFRYNLKYSAYCVMLLLSIVDYETKSKK